MNNLTLEQITQMGTVLLRSGLFAAQYCQEAVASLLAGSTVEGVKYQDAEKIILDSFGRILAAEAKEVAA